MKGGPVKRKISKVKGEVKAKTMNPAALIPALMAVYFGENVMKVSLFASSSPFSLSSAFPPSLQQSFELEAKVKKENVGRRKMEG